MVSHRRPIVVSPKPLCERENEAKSERCSGIGQLNEALPIIGGALVCLVGFLLASLLATVIWAQFRLVSGRFVFH